MAKIGVSNLVRHTVNPALLTVKNYFYFAYVFLYVVEGLQDDKKGTNELITNLQTDKQTNTVELSANKQTADHCLGTYYPNSSRTEGSCTRFTARDLLSETCCQRLFSWHSESGWESICLSPAVEHPES